MLLLLWWVVAPRLLQLPLKRALPVPQRRSLCRLQLPGLECSSNVDNGSIWSCTSTLLSKCLNV